MNSDHILIIISLFNLGFFGGFTHCIGMCGPFVVSQVTNRMQKIDIRDYTMMQKLKNQAILPYHFGRVFTYSLLGLISGLISEKINNISFFNYIAATLMIFAAIAFLNYLVDEKISKIIFKKINLPKIFYCNCLKKVTNYILPKNLISNLFKNPTGFRGFLLGVMLGFIPCGMIYTALALSLTTSSSFFSMIGMFIFAISTIPALFVAGSASYFFIDKANFKLISKLIMFINIIMLLLFAFKIIY